MYMQGYEIKLKQDTANCILTGYYCSYYMNSGKHAKDPNELIRKMFTKKQSMEDGLKDIARIKKLERGG